MSKPKITFASALYDRFLPLYTGEVQPEGFDLDFQVVDDPRELFDRVGGSAEFDVAEFSGTEYITRHAIDDSPFIALPVFASRFFRHGFTFVNRNAGIETPKDLEGRKVGVQLYTMSAAMWIRGMLQDEYGVDLSNIHWVQGALDKPGAHGTPSVLPLLQQPDLVNNESDKSLGDMLVDGEIDALMGAMTPACFHTNDDIVRLFPDYRQVELDYYSRTKIFPLMHLVVMRKDVHAAHPGLAASLYDAFSRSKDIAMQRMRFTGALRYMLPFLHDDLDELDAVFGGDHWPYGIEPNRPTLEAEVRYMVEQHYIAQPMPIEELFVDVG